MAGIRFHKTTLLALLVSLVLIAGNAAAVHVHQDGLPHYSDCDSCLQIQAQTGALGGHAAYSVDPGFHAWSASLTPSARLSTTTAFSARAPPASTLLILIL